jgi:hypothetical protein
LAVQFLTSTKDPPRAPRKEINRIATTQRGVVGVEEIFLLADLLINKL